MSEDQAAAGPVRVSAPLNTGSAPVNQTGG